MIVTIYHILGRLFRLFPKQIRIKCLNMEASFFVPINCHYVCDDLSEIADGTREPKLYEWLNDIAHNSIFFDVGTNYGQEVALVSSFIDANITVVGFDCNLYHSHFCCLNKALNNDRFSFVFAAVADKSGQSVTINTNSDTHIRHLHKKNVQYSYDVLTIALDDYAKSNKLMPTHLKIDVDGAEDLVIKGASSLMSNKTLREIFIEIDNKNKKLKNTILKYGFEVVWEEQKQTNTDILFRRI